MKAKMSFILAAALAASVLGAPVHAAEKPEDMQAQMSQMMAKAKEAGTPGAGHAVLKSVEGEWNTLSRMWMKPGDEPQKSAGTFSCPVTGEKDMWYRSEWKIGKDKQVYSMFTKGPDGNEFKSMEITYTRAK
jgi:hypothetical protein